MKKYILLFAVALTGVSCSNLLDTESSGNLTPEDFEKIDQNKLTSTMLNGAIAYMHTMGNANLGDGVSYKVLGIRMDMLGNDMVLGGNGSGWFVSDYNMANYRGQDDERPSTYWMSFYKLIYKANQVISYIDPTELTESEKAVSDNIKAQALTLRALGYYHLITYSRMPTCSVAAPSPVFRCTPSPMRRAKAAVRLSRCGIVSSRTAPMLSHCLLLRV